MCKRFVIGSKLTCLHNLRFLHRMIPLSLTISSFCFQAYRYISRSAVEIFHSGQANFLFPYVQVCADFFFSGGLSIDQFVKYSKGWVS